MVARIDRVEVRGVTRLFGATAALRGVDASFEAGTISFLQGPNGAGKSTLMSIIGTALRPTAGSVRYVPLGEDRHEARAHIGWVAHDSSCYPDLSGRENVQLAARFFGIEPQHAWGEVGPRVGAGAFAERPVRTLSRGQKQRISLARALVHRPSLLLLDEPSAGLDAASLERLEQIVVEERDRGAIVIVVSHSAGMAERLAGKVVRLERGRIVES